MDQIEQGYLAIEADQVEVRLRRLGRHARLTVKRGQGRRRTEVEIEIGLEGFRELWPLTEGRRVRKARHYVPTEAGEIEVDVYRAPLEGLITAELEFGSARLSESFEPPEWLGTEVTGVPGYANQSLATEGIPTGPRSGLGGR